MGDYIVTAGSDKLNDPIFSSELVKTYEMSNDFKSIAYNTGVNVLRYYLPTPPLGQDMTQGQFLSGV